MYDFRPYDGAVIHSIATFGEYLFPPGINHKKSFSELFDIA